MPKCYSSEVEITIPFDSGMQHKEGGRELGYVFWLNQTDKLTYIHWYSNLLPFVNSYHNTHLR